MEFWSGRFLGQSRRNYHDVDLPLCTVWRGSFINSLLTQIRVLFLTLVSIQIGVWQKDVGLPIGFSSNKLNFPFCAGVPVCSLRFGWFISFLGFSVWAVFYGKIVIILDCYFHYEFFSKLLGLFSFCIQFKLLLDASVNLYKLSSYFQLFIRYRNFLFVFIFFANSVLVLLLLLFIMAGTNVNGDPVAVKAIPDLMAGTNVNGDPVAVKAIPDQVVAGSDAMIAQVGPTVDTAIGQATAIVDMGVAHDDVAAIANGTRL
ncbi:hypothetical protein LINPERPRIM_LOCUS27819, partial [Linum perenne]